MTRKAAVTVRLPGASTAPITRTSTCSQTGAVKQARNGCIQARTKTGIRSAMAGGGQGEGRWGFMIARAVLPHIGRSQTTQLPKMPAAPSKVPTRLLRFPSATGGDKLCHAAPGAPIARLRLTGQEDVTLLGWPDRGP